MKIYLDVIFLINFGFDFLLLLTVSYILKRRIKIKRLILGALIGSMSIFLLFLDLNSFTLFLWKLGISIAMILATFSYQNIRYTMKNIVFLYLTSMMLGGGLYLFNIQFAYEQKGLVFFHNGLGINLIVLFLVTPIILYVYFRQTKLLKHKYEYYQPCIITIQNQDYHLTGFIDTGNQLMDPYFGKPILPLEPHTIPVVETMSYIMVPIHTVAENLMMKCIKAEKITIQNKEYHDIWIGLSEHSLHMEGVDVLLQSKLLE